MKYSAFTIASLLIPLAGQAQLTVNPETKLFTYEVTRQVDSVKAVDLFTRTKEWVLLKNGKVTGEVSPSMVKAVGIPAECSAPLGTLACTVDMLVRTKDGAARISFDRFTYMMDTGPTPLEGMFPKPAEAIAKKKKIAVGLETLGADLSNELTKHLKSTSDF